MSSLSNYLLTQIVNYGVPIFTLTMLLGALGIPVPTTILIIAAGAFSHQGVLDGISATVFGLIATIAGDCIGFLAGRRAGGWIHKRFGHTHTWKIAEAEFTKRGGITIFMTRILFNTIALPVNLLAGSGGYPFWRFFLYDASGETIWLLGYGTLGYIFSSQWELVGQVFSDFGGVLVGAVLLGAGIWLGYRWLKS